MSEMMRVASLYGRGDLRVVDAEMPRIGSDDDVLIRIHACGICPSDLRAYTGVRPPHRPFPFTPGHEWAGEVVAVGNGVQGFSVGDRVVPRWLVVCGKCYYCRRGMYNYCEHLQPGKVRGGFAEYGIAPAESLLKIPERVSYQEASFCEPLACCVNGSERSGIEFGDTVVVIGAGPIGLMHLQLARHSGAWVIVSDLMAERLSKATDLGANEVIDASREDPVEQVKNLTGGHGADVVIVAVGSARPLQQALDMAGLDGTVNIFAGTHPPTTLGIDPNRIHYRQLHLTGSYNYTPFHFETALHLIEAGTVKVAPLISHELELEQVKKGFDIVAGQRGLKVIIRMNSGPRD